MGKAGVEPTLAPIMGRKCWWKERRGNKWGEIVFEGLKFNIGLPYFLVTKSRHGLQVVPLMSKDGLKTKLFLDSEYNPHYDSEMVEVPRRLVRAARKALEAHEEFQRYEYEFLQLMARSDAS